MSNSLMMMAVMNPQPCVTGMRFALRIVEGRDVAQVKTEPQNQESAMREENWTQSDGSLWLTVRKTVVRRGVCKLLACVVVSLVFLPAAFGQERVSRFGNEISGPPLDKFAIEIGGKLRGYFTQCSGLGSDSDLVEFREPGAGTVQKLPGIVKYAETVCRRRVVLDTYFWDWRLLVEQGMANFRRTANVVLYDDKNTEVARWELFDAWPSRTFISETKETKGYAEEVFVLTSRQTQRIK